jgi:hypothetical protein
VKRILTVILAMAIGALVVAAVALAGTKTYTGKDKDSKCGTIGSPPHSSDCKVTFDAKIKNGKAKKVSDFVMNRVPIKCDQGLFTVSNDNAPTGTMKVKKHRKFKGHFTFAGGQQSIDVTGKFSKNWKKVSGTLRNRGDFGSGATNCDTGTDDYSAKR